MEKRRMPYIMLQYVTFKENYEKIIIFIKNL